MRIEINSDFLNNGVVIIKSLAEDDLDTASNLYDFFEVNKGSYPHIELHEVKSKAHVLNILRDIETRVGGDFRPIIHFETHGNPELGLYINDSDEFISWSEIIIHLREINIKTNNNLVVVLSSCHGLNAIKPIEIFEPSPFLILIAPEKEVKAGFIDDQIRAFYTTLFSSNSFLSAMKTINEKFVLFYSEKYFTISVVNYFKLSCSGKGAKQRKERLISEALKNIQGPSKKQLKLVRKRVKEFIKPNRHAFKRISEKFIIDKSKYTVTFTEIMKLVK